MEFTKHPQKESAAKCFVTARNQTEWRTGRSMYMTLVGRLWGPPSSVCLQVLIAGFFDSTVGTTCMTRCLQAQFATLHSGVRTTSMLKSGACHSRGEDAQGLQV